MSEKRQKHGTTTITSGKYRGVTILTPGSKTHPMGSREKIALFNMINDYLPGASVLDAYAGSGALGLEALSRGAEFVVFIDNNPSSTEAIRSNVKKLGLDATHYEIYRGNALKEAKEMSGRFDIVLADPPYDEYHPEMIIDVSNLVDKGGILIASTPIEPPEIEGMKLLKTRKYARAYISVFQSIC